ncbi:hypothetical protein [Chitinophaga nivalis]|uniref:DUF4625 domain-containing protein n=1 Tax=Chitinophaga nivalis TaxID=2991709 RepID=A0ABT3IWI5_9BACT|nr:hypothetical protein [Chitinophaga nivalis]MCW3462000.1 hypothetical protein [Chitinophaga nivalis]MCW3488309.1 hypothetical protein [Chitinophaga nivalis]
MKKVNLLSLSVAMALLIGVFGCKKSSDLSLDTDQNNPPVEQSKSIFDQKINTENIPVTQTDTSVNLFQQGEAFFQFNGMTRFPNFLKIWFSVGNNLTVHTSNLSKPGAVNWVYTQKSSSSYSPDRAVVEGELTETFAGSYKIYYTVRIIITLYPVHQQARAELTISKKMI